MRRAAVLLALLTACETPSKAGPAVTAYKAAYFTLDLEPVHEAVVKVFENWKVGVRSDDGRLVRTKAFKDGPSVWRMHVELEHAGGTTAVLVKMHILRGGDVDPDVVDPDFESIVRWKIGGDPDAFRLPATPTHSDRVKAELVEWLKAWRRGNASLASDPEDGDPEHRARGRRDLFLTFLRMSLLP